MSNTLKDIILLKRTSTESLITENSDIIQNKTLHGELILCNEKDKERLYCKNSSNILVPIHHNIDCQEIVVEKQIPEGAVDLGLPSGKLWAKCNLGANSEEESGLYYQWGDTQGYTKEQIGTEKVFDWANYKWSIGGSDSNFSKYNSTDGKTVLDLEDDAVYVALGGNWRMPTVDDWQELYDNTSRQWTQVNGVNGYKLTAHNGNYIFLPAAGCGYGSSLSYEGSYGRVWTSSLWSVGSTSAFDCSFSSVMFLPGDSNARYGGFSVRGVTTL